MESRFFGAACALAFSMLTTLAHSAVLPLEPRLGGSAFYDPNLDITWLADTDIVGTGTWENQMAWVTSLNVGGIGGWHLPGADINGDGNIVDCYGGGVVGCEDNEMGYLYWEEGITLATPGPFVGLQSNLYWSETESLSFSTSSWIFRFGYGDQRTFNKSTDLPGIAVHNGDISAVPAPAASMLFGSGLVALIGISRRSKSG